MAAPIKSYFQYDFGKKAMVNGAIYPRGLDYVLQYASRQMTPEVVLVSRPVYYQIMNEIGKAPQLNGHPSSPTLCLSYDHVKIDIFPASSSDPVGRVRVVGTPLNGLERAINKTQGKITVDDQARYGPGRE